jgi:hypothetical protein
LAQAKWDASVEAAGSHRRDYPHGSLISYVLDLS